MVSAHIMLSNPASSWVMNGSSRYLLLNAIQLEHDIEGLGGEAFPRPSMLKEQLYIRYIIKITEQIIEGGCACSRGIPA